MSIGTALQRADLYIQKQMHKFEQQKRGRTSPPRAYAGYGQISPQRHPFGRQQSQECGHPVLPPHPPQRHPPSQGPIPPPGWRQEFDTRSQRWYYIDLSTGRSQWDAPPSHPRAPILRAQTLGINQSSIESRNRHRATSQPQRPISSTSGGHYLGVNQSVRGMGSASPNSFGASRLPPGAHLDTRTGLVTTNMFPPGQRPEDWEREVGRI